MVHLIVFFIKMIVKAINGSKSNPTYTPPPTNTPNITTTNYNSQAIASRGVPNNNSNNTSKSKTDNKIFAVLIAIGTSFCCGLGIIANLVLSIVLKKVPHIIFSVLVLVGFIAFVYFNAEAEKKKTKNTYTEISFNDTLILDANNPDIASDTIKSFLYRKYATWYENQSEMIDDYSIDIMKYDLMSHKFDTLYVNNQAQYYKPIEELFYNVNSEVISEESIDDEVVSIEENKEDIPVDKIKDNNEAKTIVVYFQDKDKICLEEGEKEIKKGTYSTEKIKNKKDKENKYIGFAVLLSLLSFVQAIMLWFAFLNRKKDANQALIDDLNQSKQKPTHHTSSDNFDIPKNVAVPSTSDMPKPTPTSTSKESKPSNIPNGKIAINSVDVYNLMTIPVLNYSQALLIITERNNNGRYSSIEDIKLRNTLTDELATAIASHVYID